MVENAEDAKGGLCVTLNEEQKQACEHLKRKLHLVDTLYHAIGNFQ